MRLVREHINERFAQDSDPVHDLGIGMDVLIKRWIETETSYKYDKDNLLWICAQHGKVDFVKYLLGKGVDVHTCNDAALQWASLKGHKEIVKTLLSAGANVHTRNDFALRLASENGHEKVVKLLLDAGADVHAENDTALQWASENGHKEVVKILLDAGANVHAVNDRALQWASYHGHKEVVKILKDHIAKEKKKVKESLNEKFTQDSDPIHDMGIGVDPKRFKYRSLTYLYTAVGDEELKILKKFFKTSKNKIFYIGNSDSEYAEKVEKIISLKSTKLISEKKFKHTNNFFAVDNVKCYETKYGKVVISEVNYEIKHTSMLLRQLKWYLCDISFAAYLDYKYKAFS